MVKVMVMMMMMRIVVSSITVLVQAQKVALKSIKKAFKVNNRTVEWLVMM